MTLDLGKKLIAQKNFKKAKKIFLELYKINNSFEISYNLGVINFELKNIDVSLNFFKECKKIEPLSINTLLNIANIEQTIGEIKKSLSTYLKILEINDRVIRAYYGIYLLDPKFLENKHFEIIEKINIDPNSNLIEKFLSDFLMSKFEKNKKNFDKEIFFLNNSHKKCFESKKQFNLQSQKYYENVITKIFNTDNFINFNKKKNYFKNFSPIFIIGLPRSGSTLAEAILTSSDENIVSFGESAFINMGIVDQLPNNIFSNTYNLKEFSFKVDEFEKFIFEKYSQFPSFNEKNITLIDKSLENFLNIEFILSIFPNAKFLHCHRNLKDSIIGIYQSLLPDLSWTHSIQEILVYVDNYLKISKYFKKKYPQKIFEISLENFTREKENVSKNIFKFCELTWNNKVLEFYKRKKLDIRTTSSIQIRNEISAYDLNKYSNYFHILKQYENKYDWLN